ncbi:MAG: HAMP domain-containing protein, partial [Solirubrobacterales bacterium]
MSKVSGLTVKGRIWGGFILVIAFLMVVAVLGVIGFTSVKNNIEEYDRVTDNAVRVLNIERNLVGLRRNVLVFTGSSGDDKAITRIRELQASLRKDLGEAIAATRNADRKAMLEQMKALFEQYSGNFEKVVELRGKRDQILNERMLPVGAAMRTSLTEVIDAAMTERDFESAALAGKAQEQLMLARLTANRFVATPNEKLVAEAKDRFGKTEAAVKALTDRSKDARVKKAAETIHTQLPVYDTAFGEVVSATVEVDRIITKVNAGLAQQFAELSAKIKQSQVDTVSALGDEAKDTATLQRNTSAILSTLAVLLGLAFAVLIARSIVNPVNAMTGAMGELAGGRLDVQVPALERHDEIGQMAKAVQVFKQNAIDKK